MSPTVSIKCAVDLPKTKELLKPLVFYRLFISTNPREHDLRQKRTKSPGNDFGNHPEVLSFFGIMEVSIDREYLLRAHLFYCW